MTAGTCTIAANQAGDVNYLIASQVTQNVTISPQLAGAPIIGTAMAGNAQVTINFSAPANNGGSAISSYTATCNPGALTSTSATSPITVSGLANGATYTCSVTAVNAAGTSSASSTVTVTPAVSSGQSNWNNVCAMCHSFVPSGQQLNAAGASGVIAYARTVVPGMIAEPVVQGLTGTELAEIANYVAAQVPALSSLVPLNTATSIDVSSHITLNTISFDVVEAVGLPANGSLSTFSGTSVIYTPNSGYSGADSFTYRGKSSTTGLASDVRVVSLTVAAGLQLTVVKAGNGGGTVTGTGITCGNCAHHYWPGSQSGSGSGRRRGRDNSSAGSFGAVRLRLIAPWPIWGWRWVAHLRCR